MKKLEAMGTVQQRQVRILDLFCEAGAEHLVMATGEVVRLDWLIEVDGATPPEACSI